MEEHLILWFITHIHNPDKPNWEKHTAFTEKLRGNQSCQTNEADKVSL